jgi:tetratricopeptide (TPR) repeat protein
LFVTSLQSKLSRIKFSYSETGGDRVHYLTPEDILVLLSRLPEELWKRLRAVHFNDQSRGRRTAGYVNRARREIAICAFPASVSCAPFTSRRKRCAPSTFGAERGKQWPPVAVRRYLLYNTFLHELGHLQIVDTNAKTNRRRFASETLAQRFANRWRRALWSRHFNHPDPVHNPPSDRQQAETDRASSQAAVASRRFAVMAAMAAMDKGWVFYNKRDYESAITSFAEAIKFDPHCSAAYLCRGRAYSRVKQHDEAISDFTEAIRLKPLHSAAYISRAVAYSWKKLLEKTIADCTECIHLKPQAAYAWYNRGCALCREGTFDRAIADLTEAIRIKPTLARWYARRGYAYSQSGDHVNAVCDCNEAIRLDPNDSVAYNNRGWDRWLIGDYQAAVSDYNEAVRLDPLYAEAYHNRGLANEKLGNLLDALADFEGAMRLGWNVGQH